MTTSTHPVATTTPTHSNALVGATRRRVLRAATVGGAGLAATAIFAVAHAAGTDFTITDPGQAKVPHTFVAPEIFVITVLIGLLGWATLAALERWTNRARPIWGTLAAAVVLLSMVPIGIEIATTDTRIMLGVIHAAVGVALIPLWRTSHPRSQS